MSRGKNTKKYRYFGIVSFAFTEFFFRREHELKIVDITNVPDAYL